MHNDPKASRALKRLTQLQALRVAEAQLALDDAQTKRESASAHEDTARDALKRQEDELSDLLATRLLDPSLFSVKGGMIVSHADAVRKAHEQAEIARATERERQSTWHARHHQQDWLQEQYRCAARYIRRQHEEKVALEVASLIAMRTARQPR
ncbi:hypothetical protein [Croceicoccus estronivorus]|uniref:hypothetical protein n=1 Tax=Croceicoccus estronivorus TaxID=1172626 RepID=UPI000A5A2B26|nr:hypothetical protein [Croceicoccus estronivorus]